MRQMESSNPILKLARSVAGDGQASFEGILNKTMLSLVLVILGASYTWFQVVNNGVYPTGAVVIGLILSLVGVVGTWMNSNAGGILVPIYSIGEGLILGAISGMFAGLYDGIVMQAVLITLGIFLVMLFLYRARIIRATNKFKKVVIGATVGIGVIYLLSMLLSLFGLNIPFLRDSSPLGIGISLVIVIVASLNFILDFDTIEYLVYSGAPKKMEWIGALTLLTTLVWLYIEVLRLVALFKDE
ncbi:MAG: Bax inhibitor-1/YccA family protein [Clostridium sp.]